MAETDDQIAACAKAREEVDRLHSVIQTLRFPSEGFILGGAIAAGIGLITLDPPMAVGGGAMLGIGITGFKKSLEIDFKQEPAALKEANEICSGLPPAKAPQERTR